jgi:HK97 family phage major capsid protein
MSPPVFPRSKPSSTLEEYRAAAAEDEHGWGADDPNSLFWRYVMAPGGLGARKVLNEEEYRILNKTTTTAGGFLVPQDLEAQVVSAARAASAIAQLALELQTESGDTLLLPTRTADAVGVWTAESAGYTLGDLTFGQVSLSAFKSATLVKVTEELSSDAGIPFDQYLGMELGGRLGDLQGAAFATGSGSGQPLGVVNAGSPYSVTTAATGSSTLFKGADIQAFYLALAPEYRAAASWILHPTDYGRLAGTLDTAGAFAFPSLQSAEPSLFGRPVYVDANMPTPAANAKSLVFGDFRKAYAVRRVNGVGVERLEELYADVGQIGFKGSERVDGRPTLAAAAIIGQHSAT